MVKTVPSNEGGVGLVPGCRDKIPHASCPQNKKIYARFKEKDRYKESHQRNGNYNEKREHNENSRTKNYNI